MVNEARETTIISEFTEDDLLSPSSFGKQKGLKTDIVNAFIYKYYSLVVTAIVLYILRDGLPFPFPHFFFLTIGLLIANLLMHFCLRFDSLFDFICKYTIFFDQISSGPIFFMTGGFLSPFILTHMAAILGSINSYAYTSKSSKKSLALTLILLISYLSVSLLQKFHIIPNYVAYSNELMNNNVFFYTILAIISGVIIGSYDVLSKVRDNLNHQFLDMVHSYQYAVKGVTSKQSGDYFYSDLLFYACKALGVKNMVLCILDKEKKQLETISVVKDLQISHNLVIPIKNTAFEKVLKLGQLEIDSDFHKSFEEINLFRGMKVESFFGKALKKSSTGEILGVLAVFRNFPCKYDKMTNSLLEIFVSRATAQIEKELYEKENNEIEERLHHSQKMEALGKLSGGIAHDFNNMIGGIQGYSEILKIKLKKRNVADLIQYPEKINMLTKQATTLTSQLLQFARKGGARQVKLNINEEIESLVDILSHTLTKSIKIRSELGAKRTLILGDETQLQNAFLNICVNARDAMPDGGSIVIVTEDCDISENDKILTETSELDIGSFVKITISDSGVGMPKEILKRIFEPFYTTKKPGSGTGLGLSSVFGCIEKHDGHVDVASEPGKGTSFFIYLPIIDGA